MNPPYFEFIKAGLQTSIQDFGRTGLQHLGVSKSGAMDPRAMHMANWLIGNSPDAPVLEITQIGPILIAHAKVTVAICGAEFELTLNNKPISGCQPIVLTPNDKLAFGRLIQGARAYLAIRGSFDLAQQLGSYSTHLTAGFGGYKNRQFVDGDKLYFTSRPAVKARQLSQKIRPSYSGNYLLRCVDSLESDQFTSNQKDKFLSNSYQVSPNSNRMGIRLKGEPILSSLPIEIVSTGLTQGSIQIPADGMPIISSVDGQTIGGYPRIANLIASDLPLLGQLKAGDKIGFALVDLLTASEINAKNVEAMKL